MKVLNPSNTSHSITLYPREYPTGDLSLDITKEGYNTLVTLTPTYSVADGVMTLNFDLEGVEQDRFSIKLTKNDTVIYMGKLFFTSQETQDFKLTKFVYAE